MVSRRRRVASCRRSHPAWGAWIEIACSVCVLVVSVASHPAWGAWIEISISRVTGYGGARSHPAWGAWIEIAYVAKQYDSTEGVAPRMGCVD